MRDIANGKYHIKEDDMTHVIALICVYAMAPASQFARWHAS